MRAETGGFQIHGRGVAILAPRWGAWEGCMIGDPRESLRSSLGYGLCPRWGRDTVAFEFHGLRLGAHVLAGRGPSGLARDVDANSFRPWRLAPAE